MMKCVFLRCLDRSTGGTLRKLISTEYSHGATGMMCYLELHSHRRTAQMLIVPTGKYTSRAGPWRILFHGSYWVF